MTLGMNIELVIYRTIFKPHMHTLTLTHTYPFIIIAEHIAVYCPNVIIECNVFIEIVDQNNINAKSTVYAFWFRLLVPLLYSSLLSISILACWFAHEIIMPKSKFSNCLSARQCYMLSQ